jgi:hypothetical protein
MIKLEQRPQQRIERIGMEKSGHSALADAPQAKVSSFEISFA